MSKVLRLVFRSTVGSLCVLALAAACSGTGSSSGGASSGGSSASGGSSGSGTGGTSGSGTGGFGAVSGSSGDGGSGGVPDGAACNAVSATAKQTAANVLIVLDLSGSMSDLVGLQSRWQITRKAFLSVLPNLPSALRMGLVYFGHPKSTPGCTATDPGCCTRDSTNGGPDIPIQPLDNTQKAFITNWMTGTTPSNNNNTPTADALKGAYDILTHSGLDGNYYALLMTDGGENCGGTGQPQLAGDAAAATPSIKTFVIGSPGSDGARQMLSDIALDGGTRRTPTCDGSAGNTCHYDLSSSTSNFQADLTAALSAILGQTTLPCVFDIPSQDGGAFDDTKVNVKYTNGSGSSADVLFDKDCASASKQGWNYSPDKKQIVLCQSICDVVKQDPNGKIDILFGCPTVPIN